MLQANGTLNVLQDRSSPAPRWHAQLGKHFIYSLLNDSKCCIQTEYAVQVDEETGYDWIDGEEKVSPGPSQLGVFTLKFLLNVHVQRMLSQFNNDKVYISTKWLLRLINGRGLNVIHLLRILHLGTNATHYLAILPDNRYVCDCCMGINLGIPCR